MGPKKRPS